MVKASHSESGNLGSIPARCWNPLQPLGHLCGTYSEPVSALTRELLYYCTLYFFLDFVSGNLTLTGFYLLRWSVVNIWLPLIDTLGVGPWARTHKLLKILENKGLLWRVFNPHPQAGIDWGTRLWHTCMFGCALLSNSRLLAHPQCYADKCCLWVSYTLPSLESFVLKIEIKTWCKILWPSTAVYPIQVLQLPLVLLSLTSALQLLHIAASQSWT